MQIKKGMEKEYEDWKGKNDDPYSSCVFRYAERWAGMMEEGFLNSEDTISEFMEKNADKLSHDSDTEGITGFMYGCAVSILSQCWKYGDALKEWHNKQYNYEGDGVVNPAVLSVSV